MKKLDLREKSLSSCRACYACMQEHACAIQDDMAEIFTNMQSADVIVLFTPVYFYAVSAQIKMLTDRCLVNHKSLVGKKFYYIVTAADPRHEAANEAIAVFRGFLRCLPDAEEAGILYGTGAWRNQTALTFASQGQDMTDHVKKSVFCFQGIYFVSFRFMYLGLIYSR